MEEGNKDQGTILINATFSLCFYYISSRILMSPSTCWVAKHSKIEGWGQENSMKNFHKTLQGSIPEKLIVVPCIYPETENESQGIN
jgi:hypothetical protein